MEEDCHSIEDFVVADALFHRAILRAANNEILLSMEGVIFSALLSSIRLTNRDPRDNENSIPFHRKSLEAIKSRDHLLAEEMMNATLSDTSQRLESALETTLIGNGGRQNVTYKGHEPQDIHHAAVVRR